MFTIITIYWVLDISKPYVRQQWSCQLKFYNNQTYIGTVWCGLGLCLDVNSGSIGLRVPVQLELPDTLMMMMMMMINGFVWPVALYLKYDDSCDHAINTDAWHVVRRRLLRSLLRLVDCHVNSCSWSRSNHVLCASGFSTWLIITTFFCELEPHSMCVGVWIGSTWTLATCTYD